MMCKGNVGAWGQVEIVLVGKGWMGGCFTYDMGVACFMQVRKAV